MSDYSKIHRGSFWQYVGKGDKLVFMVVGFEEGEVQAWSVMSDNSSHGLAWNSSFQMFFQYFRHLNDPPLQPQPA
jgi:hypothetical protein